MSFPVGIESYNYNFLYNLQQGKKVGLSEDGKRLVYLAQDPKAKEVGTSIIEGMAVSEVVRQLSKPLYLGEGGRNQYLALLDHFKEKKLFNSDQIHEIAVAYYAMRAEKLHPKREVAEALAAYEMSLDRNIHEKVRSKLLPEFARSGSSGVYFFKDREGNNIGVFKPSSEEPFMKGNPRGHDPIPGKARLARAGHVDGSGWLCEIAAHAVDEGSVGVPYTTRLKLMFPKWKKEKQDFKIDTSQMSLQEGSFQVFQKGVNTVAAEIPAYKDIPVDHVQKLVASDFMLGNADRSLDNIFWDSQNKKLIPFDHGLTFLDNFDYLDPQRNLELTEGWTQMFTWPHVAEPVSDATKKWIKEYDLDAKCKKLKDLGISDGAIREFRLRALFLKEGINQGYNLYQLGKLCMLTGDFKIGTTWLGEQVKAQREALKNELTKVDKEQAEKLFEEQFKKRLMAELPKQKKFLEGVLSKQVRKLRGEI